MQAPEYVYEILTDNLREALAKAGTIMTEVLEYVLVASGDESEVEATEGLIRALVRYRDAYCSADPSSEVEDDEINNAGELVE